MSYNYTVYKLLDWIDINKLDLVYLSLNENAIYLLEQNQCKIDWKWLSCNKNAIHLLEQNQDKIDWYRLSFNKNAIHLLEQNQDKIYWECLSYNKNAIYLLEQNQDKIDWGYLSRNPSIFEIDYNVLKNRIEPFKEELMQKCFHPTRLVRYLETYRYDIGEEEYT